MPDLLIQQVDAHLFDRIKTLARQRQLTVNEVLLQVLRRGLERMASEGLSENVFDAPEENLTDGRWEADERSIFQEAVRALAQTPATQFAPEKLRAELALAAGAE